MTSLKSAALAALFALGVAAPAFAQSAMAPAAAPTTAPAASSTMAPATTKPAKPAKVKKPTTTTTASKSTAGRFKTEAEAKASCPMDTVVWASSKSKAYHLSTSKLYGKTKSGAYECQKTADAAGYHAAKD
ncbi:MAG: hypothetical protein P4L54_03405 [Acidocella sp.]|nr:hypothetical protein [Acidocella sp.]